MIIALTLLCVFVTGQFLAIAVMAWLCWAMQRKVEAQATRLLTLETKVKEGEDVIIHNFEELEKRFIKLQHELQENKQSDRLKAQEVAKAAARIERLRQSQQT